MNILIRHSGPITFFSFFQDNLIKINLFLGILLNLGLWFWLFWQSRSFTDLITLHYNIYFGIDLLGPWYQIFLLPALGSLFLVLNVFLTAIVYKKEKILGYFLMVASSFSQVIFILAAIFIIFVNQ